MDIGQATNSSISMFTFVYLAALGLDHLQPDKFLLIQSSLTLSWISVLGSSLISLSLISILLGMIMQIQPDVPKHIAEPGYFTSYCRG